MRRERILISLTIGLSVLALSSCGSELQNQRTRSKGNKPSLEQETKTSAEDTADQKVKQTTTGTKADPSEGGDGPTASLSMLNWDGVSFVGDSTFTIYATE